MIRMTMMLCALLLAASMSAPAAQAHEEKYDARDQWWWDAAWWDGGRITPVHNYTVTTKTITYKSGDKDIPAMVARPKKKGRYPAILYQHGRRGLDALVQLQVKRIAARGFIVLAPDIYSGNFMEPFPYEHDYALEDDVNHGLDALFKLPGVINRKTCLVSHTRGGYYTLKVAVTKGRQLKDVVCYVSWYPHMQDPNAPEPSQVYGYAPEADKLKIPVLIFIGENEQYQRRRVSESAVKSLKGMKRDATLVIYPGVGRGFDFRPVNVRTFADDLAAKDAVQRTDAFLHKHLDKYMR